MRMGLCTVTTCVYTTWSLHFHIIQCHVTLYLSLVTGTTLISCIQRWRQPVGCPNVDFLMDDFWLTSLMFQANYHVFTLPFGPLPIYTWECLSLHLMCCVACMSVGWESGRRCTLFDKDHPLKNMKHGRLYLTANYLCYEQSSKQKDPESRFSIAIREISYVTKVGRDGKASSSTCNWQGWFKV